ncbi:DNA polymerase [Human adenovirus 7]|uniref:DNA polymerase n=1 Tax=Human adenovirus B serotype 7 TaxID=10519 RepID=A0A219PC29_ADE07|nr:DNA polymerase [Human adenovirus 7]
MQEATEPPPPKRKNKGTVVAPKGHGTLQAIDISTNGPVEIKYHLNLPHALEKIMQVNLLTLPTNLTPQRLRTLDSSGLRALVLELRPCRAEVWTCLPRGLVSMTTIETEDGHADADNIVERQVQTPGLNFPLKFLVKGSQVQLIHEVHPVNRCEYCGRLYKHKHECSARRREFYFHHINSHSSNWWHEVQFFPIGSSSHRKALPHLRCGNLHLDGVLWQAANPLHAGHETLWRPAARQHRL